MDWTKFSEFGLTGVFLGAIIFILWRMIVWVMGFVKEQQKQQSEERAAWLCRLKEISELVSKGLQSIEEHDKNADERGRYVREEHKEMIEVLNRINGYKKQ